MSDTVQIGRGPAGILTAPQRVALMKLLMLDRKPDLSVAPEECGSVLSVRGSVIDVHFGHNLPAINNLLRAGDHEQVLIEVWAQLDANRVRGIAMTPPQGLARGARVVDTGAPLKVPVGKAIRSRMFNVFGQKIGRAHV